ncbi:MAG: PhoH family protein [Bacteroidales bacterium]
MSEIYIEIAPTHPVDIFGLEEEKLKVIKKFFPQINIILRGTLLKATGDSVHLTDFEAKMKLILYHFERFNRLNETDISSILGPIAPKDTKEEELNVFSSDTILIGVNGRSIRALTKNQLLLVEASKTKDLVFAIGPAGSGKTYTAVALAVNALKNKEVKRIILTRPAVEAGENLGFLPGDMKEKLDPYMQPLYDALRDMIPYQKLLTYLEESTIEIAPLAFMRGRTLDHAFVILDEAQNTTENQMKMFLTRMGKNAKFIITGDITQVDLPGKQLSGLIHAQKTLKSIRDIGFIYLTAEDVVRHKLVAQIIKAYDRAKNEINV